MGRAAEQLDPASGDSSQCTPTANRTSLTSTSSSDAGPSGGATSGHTRSNTGTGALSDGEISDSYDEVPRELGAQVLYVKDSVWVWPNKRSRIMGRLALTLQRGVLFISWLPYSPGTINPDGTFQPKQQAQPDGAGGAAAVAAGREGCPADLATRGRYAIRPTAVSEIDALTKHTPTIGCHYILLSMQRAVYPPLYFHNGGIKAMLAVIKEHVKLVKTVADPNTYVVASDCGPLQPHLSLDCSDVRLGGPPRHSDATVAPAASRDAGGDGAGPADSAWLDRSLFALSTVETFAERSVTALQRLVFPETLAALVEVQEESSMNSAMQDLYSKGPLCRARRKLAAASASGDNRDAEPTTSPGGGAAGAVQEEVTGVGSFEVITAQRTQRRRRQSPPPVTLGAEEWAASLDSEGRVIDRRAVEHRIYTGGVAPELRREVWKFLLGVYRWDSTAAERAALLEHLNAEYAAIRQQWAGMTAAQARQWAKWRERKAQVDKDVIRTDRDQPHLKDPKGPDLVRLRAVLLSYVMYNQDLGYCQGMSDVLSPLIMIMPQEGEAFWCFVALMQRLGCNFDRDQTACQLQLAALGRLVALLDPPLHAVVKAAACTDMLFCFRWMLVGLKREFPLAEVPGLWEALWTNPLTPHLHLYVALVLLELRRHEILQPGLHYGKMHVICSSLRGSLDLQAVLADAEALFAFAGDAGAACFENVPTPFAPGDADLPGLGGEEGSSSESDGEGGADG